VNSLLSEPPIDCKIGLPWRWHVIPPIAAAAFAEKPDIPLPLWAAKNVFLDRRMTTRPGFYDPEEYPWTWEFQEIIRTRHVWEKKLDDGAVVIVDPGTEGATCMRVHDVAAMKSTQTGFTESALNGVRYCAKHDPQNVIFSIDNAKQAAEVNEIRLQPTLRKLGEEVLPADDDDVGRFLIKMVRMLIYFLGSYSAGAFTQKLCELGILDELEKHGSKTSADELRGRMKSSPRRLCVLMSRPEKVGGPIDKEHKRGSMHVQEVPCPRCTEKNGGIPTGFQMLEQDQMKFGHCRNLLGELDKEQVMRDTYFECVHCAGRINETEKRWMNDRKRRRWRRTNFNADPNFISFHISDFLSYDESVSWGRLAIKYHNSKGDPVARQSYRNEHEGLPYEVRATKTSVGDILSLRGPYKLGQIPWKPDVIILAGDVGQAYVKYNVIAGRFTSDQEGEAAIIDYGQLGAPAEFVQLLKNKRYVCRANKKTYPITWGLIDAKWNRIEVHKACLRMPKRLFPCAGISADMSARSITFRRVPQRPSWFRLLLFIDRDAKNELYVERMAAWATWLRNGKKKDEVPLTARLWFPENLVAADKFVIEHTKENLVEMPEAHAAKQFVWKRSGANHWGDCTKVGIVGLRLFLLSNSNDPAAEEAPEPDEEPTPRARRKRAAAATHGRDDAGLEIEEIEAREFDTF
jgi:hypothetical protein